MANFSSHSSSIEVTSLDRRLPHHLGMIARLIDEMGLVEQINELVVGQLGRRKSQPWSSG